MKRKQSLETAVAYFTRSKRPKLYTGSLPTRRTEVEYIPATCTRNYMLKDTLIDWIKVHGSYNSGEKSNKGNMNSENKGFTSFIMEKGIEFEAELIKYINDKKISVVTVSNYITDSSVKKTIDLMKKGTPVIHSAPVRNTKNNTHGIIDLLVRSDCLHQLVNECPLTLEEQIISSPKLGFDFHYVVIDVKFSTLPLRADGRHLLNSSSFPAYKSQCLIYNDAIGNIQGYTSPYAFILGRRWTYNQKDIKHSNLTCLDKLGVIDYSKVDKSYVKETENALVWVRENKKYGHQWSISPPSRKELYPNMCCDSGKWQQQKEQIARDIGEISSIWYCGVKNRNIGIDNGITSWKDPKCTSTSIGINGSRAPIIDKILDINRQNKDKIRPKKIQTNTFDWKEECNEMFVDFETLSDIFSSFSDLPTQKQTDMIFMIGVWYKPNETSTWVYKRFTCNKATYEEEYRIMDEFVTFSKDQGNPKLWYWFAEKRFWKRSENRQFDYASNTDNEERTNRIPDHWGKHNWVDMYELFKNEPIVIKDCFKFNLKSIAHAMYKHGLIKTTMESQCTSGMTAMVNAWKCYNDFTNPSDCSVMQDIARYNKFDVSVMEDILTYLRKTHT